MNGDTFFHLANLKELILKLNNVKELNAKNFKGLILLNFLDLSYNQIVSCQDETFFYLKNAIILKLSSNNLRNLFKSLSFQSLQFLDLSFNKLTSIDLKFSKNNLLSI